MDSWLTLWRLPGIGSRSVQKLLNAFGSPEEALRASEQSWRMAGLKGAQLLPVSARQADISADLRWLEAENHHLLKITDSDYPPQLANIPSAPPLLFVQGDRTLLQHPQLAMVGSRNPTRGGIQNAKAFATHLASQGFGITSGLAIGIDGACHEAALDTAGITIAVAATGLDRVYPAKHRNLARRIASEGAIVSEFPIGTRPRAEHFPQRNRIISGLSLGTLVVEAARKSGSLISARYANDQGRELFAIPGSIHNPLARGCHQLIRQGAKLVETAEDILEELGPLLPKTRDQSPPHTPNNATFNTHPPSNEQAQLLEHIDFDPTPVDVIISRCGLTPEAVSSMLLIMELDGQVAAEPGGFYVRLAGN